jgi:glycosyltransferase involved in cell wall biosynthesis
MSTPLSVVQMLPELVGGGVERGTLEMAKYLVDHGHCSTVISSGGPMVEQLTGEGSKHIAWPIGKKSITTLRYIKKARNFLRETQPDILHLRSRLPAWVGYLAWKKLPKNKRPHLITTVHGQYSVSTYSSVMVRGEKVIAVSETIRKYILNNYSFVKEKDIEVIHRGVDRDQYIYGYRPNKAWQETWHGQFPQMQNKLLLTLPGRLTRLKGHHDFISVIDALIQSGNNVHGAIVGGVHPKKKKYVEELHRKIDELNLGPHITFVGQRSDMREVLAQSDVVFSLSQTPESFGRTTLEALSLGTPVLGYDHGGVREQLKAIYPNGLVDVSNVDGVVVKLQEGLPRLAMPAPAHVFDLETMCSKTLSVYKEIKAK